jgi:hypothetical protein
MQKFMQVFVAAVMVMGFAAAAQASTITYDYDRSVDFRGFRKAAWKFDADAGDPSMEQARIERALSDGFRAKGYAFVTDAGQADFLVTYRAAAWRETEVSDTDRGPGFGRSLRVDRTPKGVLLVEVYDAKSGKLAWHGTVSDALAKNGDEAEQKTRKAVTKLLKKFPDPGGQPGVGR